MPREKDLAKLDAKVEPAKIKDDPYVKQSNRLTNASYSLNATDQKIVLAITSQLKKDGDDFETTKINVTDIARLCGFDMKNAYRIVRAATINLMERVIRMRADDGKGEYLTHWVQSCRYYPADNGREACMVYRIDDSIRRDLLKLRRAYVSFKLADAMQFDSQYAMRLYPIFLEWKNIGKVTYTPDKFRNMLGIEKKKSYASFSNVRIRVIDPALAEINEKSDLSVRCEVKKGGRGNKVSEFTFRIKMKNPSIMPANVPTANDIEAEGVDPLDEALNALPAKAHDYFPRLVQVGLVSEHVAVDLLKAYGYDRCHSNLEAILPQKPEAKNFGGKVVKAIREDWAGTKHAQKIEEENERKRKEHDRRQAAAGIVGGETALQQRASEIQSVGDVVKDIMKPAMPPADAKAAAAWSEMIEAVELPALAKEKWLHSCVPVSVDNGILKIVVPNDFVRNWVCKKYLPTLTAVAANAGVDSIEVSTVS